MQFIRAGNALFYGLEPGPAINLVSRKPVADRKHYARVFQSGLEPGLGRTYYAGASYEF